MALPPHQHVKRHESISFDDIMPLFDYHPWDDGQNPRIDNITHTLLNIKNSSADRRRPAVKFFNKVLVNPPGGISRLATGDPRIYAIVPSHSRGCVSPGLIELVTSVAPQFGFANDENVLFRHTTVPKAATGGPRGIHVHLSSIQVTHNVEGCTVYLFDDVTSTGSSLRACKQLLLEAGAARVAMIALGQTYMEH